MTKRGTTSRAPPLWAQILAVVTFLLIYNIRNARWQLVVGLMVLVALLICPTRVTGPSVRKTKDASDPNALNGTAELAEQQSPRRLSCDLEQSLSDIVNAAPLEHP
mmetsp:Transcript_21579/g.39582  ORF Transcript_21579/g.39582 Transcript_21579/m.39582 type:complete len:106 (+) Transcript_21579:189-506(+)